MSILYDEGQQAIATESRRVLDARMDKGRLLKLLEQVGEHDQPFWDTAVEQGWTALAIPEEHGGLGLGLTELGLVAQACGAATSGAPFLTGGYGLAQALVQVDVQRVHDLHMVQSVLALPEHLDLFDSGIASRLDFSFSGPQATYPLRAGAQARAGARCGGGAGGEAQFAQEAAGGIRRKKDEGGPQHEPWKDADVEELGVEKMKRSSSAEGEPACAAPQVAGNDEKIQ